MDLKNIAYGDVTPCGSCKNRRNLLLLLVTVNVVHSSPIIVTLIMEALGSSETSVLTRVTRRNIPEGGILHSNRLENLKSYTAFTGWALRRRSNVSPVRYHLDFYIPEDGIFHSHRSETLRSYLGNMFGKSELE
jgi:hypothetical protein